MTGVQTCALPISRLQVGNIHEADEMYALVVEAVITSTLCAFAETLQVLLAVVGEHVVLAGNKVNLLRRGSP